MTKIATKIKQLIYSAKMHRWFLTCLRGKCCETPGYEQMATALYI